MKLFWVTTDDHDEDWFVVASSSKKAERYFENYEGYGSKEGIFAKEEFSYDSDNDIFIYPSGETLTRRKFRNDRRTYEYMAPASKCKKCEIKDKCTRSKTGRTLKRHERQDELDLIIQHTKSKECKND